MSQLYFKNKLRYKVDFLYAVRHIYINLFDSVPNEISTNVALGRLHHVPELRCRDALLVGLYYVFNHVLLLVGFHVSFKYQIKHQIFLVAARMETRRVAWIINYQNFYYN